MLNLRPCFAMLGPYDRCVRVSVIVCVCVSWNRSRGPLTSRAAAMTTPPSCLRHAVKTWSLLVTMSKGNRQLNYSAWKSSTISCSHVENFSSFIEKSPSVLATCCDVSKGFSPTKYYGVWNNIIAFVNRCILN